MSDWELWVFCIYFAIGAGCSIVMYNLMSWGGLGSRLFVHAIVVLFWPNFFKEISSARKVKMSKRQAAAKRRSMKK